MTARVTLRPDPNDGHAVVLDFGGVSIRFDGDAIDNIAIVEGDAAVRLARALCWDSVLTEAADRLAAESPNYGYGNDQRERSAFIEAVKDAADAENVREIASLRRDVERLEASNARAFKALGGWSHDDDRPCNNDAHRFACDVIHGTGAWAAKEPL